MDRESQGSGTFYQFVPTRTSPLPLPEHNVELHTKFLVSAWLSMLSKREQATGPSLRVPSALYLGPTPQAPPREPGKDLWPVFHFKRIVASDFYSTDTTEAFWVLVGEFTNATPRTVYARVLYTGSETSQAVGRAVVAWFSKSAETDIQGVPNPDNPSASVQIGPRQTTLLENEADILAGSIGIVDHVPNGLPDLLLRTTELTSHWNLSLRKWITIREVLQSSPTLPSGAPRLRNSKEWYSSIVAMGYIPYWRLSKSMRNPIPSPVPLLLADANAIWDSVSNLRAVTQERERREGPSSSSLFGADPVVVVAEEPTVGRGGDDDNWLAGELDVWKD